MKVFHFLLDHRIGGPHIYTKALVNKLVDKAEATIVTTGKGPLTDISLVNIRHYWKPLYLLEIILNVFYILICIRKFRSYHKKTIYHVHGALNIAPLIAAWLARIPVLWLIHDTSPKLDFIVQFGKFFMRGNHKKIATVSIKAKEEYSLSSAEFLPGAVSPSFWSPEADCIHDEVNELIRFPQGLHLKLLSVGNLNPIKGIDVLLRSLEEFSLPFHLIIVGAELSTHRKYLAVLHSLVDNIVQRSKFSTIQFLGWQDKESIRSLLADCDIFILPSLSEACPIALLEAMSMRCLCVATDVGDVRLIIKNAIGAQLVKPGDPESLLQGIYQALHTKENGNNYNPGLDKSWHIDNLASETLIIYQNLLTQ